MMAKGVGQQSRSCCRYWSGITADTVPLITCYSSSKMGAGEEIGLLKDSRSHEEVRRAEHRQEEQLVFPPPKFCIFIGIHKIRYFV